MHTTKSSYASLSHRIMRFMMNKRTAWTYYESLKVASILVILAWVVPFLINRFCALVLWAATFCLGC